MPFPQRRKLPVTKEGMDGPMPMGPGMGGERRDDSLVVDQAIPGLDEAQPGDPRGPIPERAGVEPRDNPTLRGAGMATPSRPMSPSPMAGSTFSPMPFEPLEGPPPASLASPQRRGLYGSMGGLKGGGLGVPLDPTANEASDPISSLIQMLQQRMGR